MQACFEGWFVVRLSVTLGGQKFSRARRPDQTADMGGRDAAAACRRAPWRRALAGRLARRLYRHDEISSLTAGIFAGLSSAAAASA
jgi:hypothetical protein